MLGDPIFNFKVMKRETYFCLMVINFIGFIVCLITGQYAACCFAASAACGFALAYGKNKYK